MDRSLNNARIQGDAFVIPSGKAACGFCGLWGRNYHQTYFFFLHRISSHATQNYLLVYVYTLPILCKLLNFIFTNPSINFKECLIHRFTYLPNTRSVFRYMFALKEIISFLLTQTIFNPL